MEVTGWEQIVLLYDMLLRELGHPGQARAVDRRALELTANPAERAVLQQRTRLGLAPWQRIQLSGQGGRP